MAPMIREPRHCGVHFTTLASASADQIAPLVAAPQPLQLTLSTRAVKLLERFYTSRGITLGKSGTRSFPLLRRNFRLHCLRPQR
ncbi:hypothetical protein K431DRAFT_289353 [Polychaeton citri CBS 116435]|uniref:Uncharacterized protein n=1 Tax=Polychaeton citri CBS 116435 TaxID=1314669 RepID=A0A9P4UKP4_9PEZI|nr:hypothetical protein K431DRAFT_289353 [Polychaeton citri CBS 116435]